LTVYADTSFFVSLYVWDSHSLAARDLLKAHLQVWFTPFNLTECSHAIAQQVFRGRISQDQAEAAYHDLERDLAARLWVEVTVPERVFMISADLGRRYAPKIGVRSLDSLHVACALELKAERFWTFDERQARLAKSEGLKTS
jgi:predicted nucleic acid-binding protein